MRRFLQHRRRLAIACALLLVGSCALFWLGPLSVQGSPENEKALAERGGEGCRQFIQHKYPSSPLVQKFNDWKRKEFSGVRVNARIETPHGTLLLYHVECPASPGWLTLQAFRLVGTTGNGDRHIIADDVNPERPPFGSQFIQMLSSKQGWETADGRMFSTAFGQILDPAVDHVEATLETGQIVRAERTAASFLILTDGLHSACEIRALDQHGAVLERILDEAPQCGTE